MGDMSAGGVWWIDKRGGAVQKRKHIEYERQRAQRLRDGSGPLSPAEVVVDISGECSEHARAHVRIRARTCACEEDLSHAITQQTPKRPRARKCAPSPALPTSP